MKVMSKQSKLLLYVLSCAGVVWTGISVTMMIWHDEAVWTQKDVLYCKINGVESKVRVFLTSEQKYFFDFYEINQQWVADTQFRTQGYVLGQFKVTKRFGKWIAKGLPIPSISIDDAVFDEDYTAVVTRNQENHEIYVKQRLRNNKVVEIGFR